MGIKKFFKTKPPTEEEVDAKVRDEMNEMGIPVKSQKKKPQMFQAYSKYANDKSEKKVYAPKGYEEFAVNNRGDKVITPGQSQDPYNGAPVNSDPYAADSNGASHSNPSNPYATMGSTNSYHSNGSNPYSASGSTQAGGSNDYSQRTQSSNPYGTNSTQVSNPYGSSSASQPSNQPSNPYGSVSSQPAPSYRTYPDGASQRINPYAKRPSVSDTRQDSYNKSYTANKTAVDEEEDLNEYPDNASTVPPSYRQEQLQHPRDQEFDFEDLNADVHREQDNAYGYQEDLYQEQAQQLSPEELEEQEKQRQEDEEVEQIKGQIRFTKQESVASTRNTLRMAREAEESGKNTLGMLGNQSENIYNIERNLDLAKTQDRIAKEKVAQLNHYNRNILKPSMQNPFTKSRKLREKEERIKNDRLQSKFVQEQQRRELSQSTNRIKAGLNEREEAGESITAKYRREKNLQEAKRYQFENDSEDDEMENEIGDNIEEIGKIASRLKRLAINQGEEIDSQNYRLRNVEEDMNDLDINVHLNTTRLAGTR